MASQTINPGQSTVLTATPLDASGAKTTLPSGDVPQWSVSDASNVNVLPSQDGLSLDVTVGSSAPASDLVFTIKDANVASAVGTFTLTVVSTLPPAPNPVASFSITASAPTP